MRLLFILGLALAGCATPCASTITQASRHVYNCTDGSRLVVTFNPSPNPVHIEQVGFAPLDLPPERSSYGYRFAREGAEFRGRAGDDAVWTRPGAAATICREERRA